MDLQQLALEAARVAQDVGKHAFQAQASPTTMVESHIPDVPGEPPTLPINDRLVPFIENRLTYRDRFNGFWHAHPQQCQPGERYWCVGRIDGAINFVRDMSEWTVTISLFEIDEHGGANPILGVVHAPALELTYLAARGKGAIRIWNTPFGNKRQKIIPTTRASLDGSVISYGMSYVPSESERALHVVAALAGKPADIKRVGPVSLDMCKVADGTYDAYFEPHLHSWDIPAVSAGTVVVREAQGQVSRWDGQDIRWREENDVVASNGLLIDQLRPYLHD